MTMSLSEKLTNRVQEMIEEEDRQSSCITEMTIKVGPITFEQLDNLATKFGCSVERQAYVVLSNWAVKRSKRARAEANPEPEPKRPARRRRRRTTK